VPPEPKKATIIVEVRGLPAGLNGDITLQGTSFVRALAHSDTLAGLTAGTYSLIAQPVENTNARYASGLSTQQVTLLPGETRSIVIDYAEITGRLAIAIDGVTADVVTTIDVTGPAGFATRLSRGDTLRKLVPGAYIVAAAPTPGSSHFVPDTTSRTVRVDSAKTASVTVRFQPFVSLTVQIDGLPQGIEASVDVAGPSFTKHLSASATLSELPIGKYTATPSTVAVGADVYRATAQSVTLTFAGPNTIAIHYVRQLAEISFRIQGGPVSLGKPNLPIVTVSGPGGAFSLSADTTIAGLPFGTYRYTVTAPTYEVHGTVYWSARGAVYASSLAGRSDLTVTLDSLHPSASVVVPLTLVSGAVTFSALGTRTFPSTSVGLALSASPASVADVSNGSLAFNIPPGTYTAIPSSQSYYDDWDWPGVLSTTVTLTSAFPVGSVVIPYHPLSWPTISFNYSGMPSGYHVGFFLSGDRSAYRDIVFAPSTIPHGDFSLPGSYHATFVVPTTAADSTAAWTMSPKTINFTVQEGQTATITIPMVPTNILKVAATGTPLFAPTVGLPRGYMSVTFPDGHTVDFTDFSYANGTIMIADQPVGNYVIKANPITLGNATYVPNLPSQTVSLPATGRIVVNIAYTLR